jgi:hypothetical protein
MSRRSRRSWSAIIRSLEAAERTERLKRGPTTRSLNAVVTLQGNVLRRTAHAPRPELSGKNAVSTRSSLPINVHSISTVFSLVSSVAATATSLMLSLRLEAHSGLATSNFRETPRVRIVSAVLSSNLVRTRIATSTRSSIKFTGLSVATTNFREVTEELRQSRRDDVHHSRGTAHAHIGARLGNCGLRLVANRAAAFVQSPAELGHTEFARRAFDESNAKPVLEPGDAPTQFRFWDVQRAASRCKGAVLDHYGEIKVIVEIRFSDCSTHGTV